MHYRKWDLEICRHWYGVGGLRMLCKCQKLYQMVSRKSILKLSVNGGLVYWTKVATASEQFFKLIRILKNRSSYRSMWCDCKNFFRQLRLLMRTVSSHTLHFCRFNLMIWGRRMRSKATTKSLCNKWKHLDPHFAPTFRSLWCSALSSDVSKCKAWETWNLL